MTEQNAKATFHNSINRILAVIEAMDNGETVTKQVAFWKDRVKARTGDLPKGQNQNIRPASSRGVILD